MINIWLILIIIFEFVSFLLSVIYYKSLKRNALTTLPYYLFFVLAGEAIGVFVIGQLYHSNISYYNTLSTLQIGFLLVFIHKSIYSPWAKKVLAICIGFFLIASVVNYYLIKDEVNALTSYSFTIGCLFITLGSAYFFYELLVSTNVENYTTYPRFWIMLGLFIFYVCNIPYMSVYNYLSLNYMRIFTAYFKIIEVLNYIMYSFFIIGIVCSSRRKSHLH
ncbi:MAG TPA: hypothetical protein PK289_07790 [Bacteroidia bacterium]|jgi:hypothetical protein|nr:hypothetical protein [Bacteroidia bacterium]HRG52980.1 hypothetical protein [Bacteroidia bacterium]